MLFPTRTCGDLQVRRVGWCTREEGASECAARAGGTGRRHGMSICSLGLRWWGWCRDFSNRKRVCCANRILQARAASASRICLTSRLQRATDLAKPQTSQAQLSNDQVSYWLHHTCLLLAHLAFASHCERSLPRETNRTCLVCSL